MVDLKREFSSLYSFLSIHVQKIGERIFLQLLILIVNQEMLFKKLCVTTGVMWGEIALDLDEFYEVSFFFFFFNLLVH